MATSALLGSSMAAAHADSPNDSSPVLYVDGSNTSCTDTSAGAGSAATPFCTIQPAADAAVAGDTVEIAKGVYGNALDITSAGSAAAPIVFQAVGGQVSIADATGQTGPALTVDGASYLTFEGSEGAGSSQSQELVVDGAQIEASTHVTIDGAKVIGATNSKSGAVYVTGGSSDATVSRSILTGLSNGGILVDGGGSGDVFSTNSIEANAFGISVSGATGTDITSNSFYSQDADKDVISLASGATGATIENNIVSGLTGAASTSTSSIDVAADSISGTTLDYNVVFPVYWTAVGVMQNAYTWGGAAYSSASALFQATGQGQHDLNTNPEISSNLSVKTTAVPQLNSANGSAPGTLTTDLYGDPCTGNPILAVTGSGMPAYCARGAFQPNYTATTSQLASAVGARTVDLASYLAETLTDGQYPGTVAGAPTPAVSYTINWGDGISQTVQSSSTYDGTATLHTYAEPGTYTITQTANLTTGGTVSATTSFTTVGSNYTPINPQRLLDTRKGIGAPVAKVPAGQSVTVQIAGLDGIPTTATAVAVNLTAADATGSGYLAAAPGGDTTSTSNVNYAAGQATANSAIVPLHGGTITIYNQGAGPADVIADVSGYFAKNAGDGYADATLMRILDTRKGIGAPVAQVAANAGIPVTVAGVDGIPSGVTAVAVHVTVANTTGTGWIGAEANGAGTPGTSVFDYGKGQIVSNTVIVPVASDGKIELYNGGGDTPVDLLADVSGYFTATAPNSYVPITPTRMWDTRQLPGWTIPAGGTEQAFLEGDNGDTPESPFPSNATLVVNATVTNTTGSGYLTVYPYGTNGSGRPAVSNLDFGPGQTIANLAILPTTGPHQEVAVFNGSTGTADVVFDVFGYYANS
jgi:hypothetical protein